MYRPAALRPATFTRESTPPESDEEQQVFNGASVRRGRSELVFEKHPVFGAQECFFENDAKSFGVLEENDKATLDGLSDISRRMVLAHWLERKKEQRSAPVKPLRDQRLLAFRSAKSLNAEWVPVKMLLMQIQDPLLKRDIQSISSRLPEGSAFWYLTTGGHKDFQEHINSDPAPQKGPHLAEKLWTWLQNMRFTLFPVGMQIFDWFPGDEPDHFNSILLSLYAQVEGLLAYISFSSLESDWYQDLCFAKCYCHLIDLVNRTFLFVFRLLFLEGCIYPLSKRSALKNVGLVAALIQQWHQKVGKLADPQNWKALDDSADTKSLQRPEVGEGGDDYLVEIFIRCMTRGVTPSFGCCFAKDEEPEASLQPFLKGWRYRSYADTPSEDDEYDLLALEETIREGIAILAAN